MPPSRNSYLPPDPDSLFPHYQPDSRDLVAHRENRVTMEWLTLVHRQLLSLQESLPQCKDMTEMAERKGFIQGMRESLNILETLSDAIRENTLKDR